MKIEIMDTEPYVPTLKDIQPGQCFIDKDIDGNKRVYMMTDNNGQSPNFKSFVDLETGAIFTAGSGIEVQPCNCKVVVGGKK